MIFPKKIYYFARNQPLSLLRIFLGIVFLSAGLNRIIFFSVAHENFSSLGISPAIPLLVITITLQIAMGTLLIINRLVIPASLIIAVIVIIGIAASFIKAGTRFYANFNEVFILTATPTNIILHITYFIGILTLLLYNLNIKKKS